jgi:repressor LexA
MLDGRCRVCLTGSAMERSFEDDPMQQRVLTAIIDLITEIGQSPTVKEIAARTFTADSNVHKYLNLLEKHGRIKVAKSKSGRAVHRGISVAGRPQVRPIPLLGRVAAGEPIPSYGEDVEEYFLLPVERVGHTNAFVVKVVGDSMTGDDAIIDGDYVVVVADPEPRDGSMVVVNVDNEATVKRLWREDGRIRLESSNPAYEPLFIEGYDNPRVRGKVVGVIRWL